MFLYNCTSSDDYSLEVQDVVHSENVYLEFNKWIYSQMNHDYLWRLDMPDSLSCDYDLAPVDFYKSLLSRRDRFSYCETNNYYLPASNEKRVGYEYQRYELNCGQDVDQVLYVTSKELRKKGLRRGDVVLPSFAVGKVVRVSVDNGVVCPIDTLEAVSPFGDEQTVYLDTIYKEGNLKIGYLCYLKFDEVDELEPVFKRFYEAQIDEMVLDLRYNPGGYVSTCKYLANSIVNKSGYGQVFQQCTYNDVLTRELEKEKGSGTTISYFANPNNGEKVLGTSMYGLSLNRLIVLTSKNSASASEAAIISMRPFMDVVLIGEQTFGKGVGSWTIRDNRYKYQLQPITMRYHNALMETTPDNGLPVDYYVPDGYSTSKKELGETDEPLLAKALSLIKGGTDIEETLVSRAGVKKFDRMMLKEKGRPSFFRYQPCFVK